MMYAHQITSKVAETRRQDLITAARVRHIRKVTRTRNAQVRPQRRWLGYGAPRTQVSCPTAAA